VKTESSDLKDDEILGELLGEIKSSSASHRKSTEPPSKLPKLGSAHKPVLAPGASAERINPFRDRFLQNSISAGNFSDKFSSTNLDNFSPKETKYIN
jgi:hypothetical protein